MNTRLEDCEIASITSIITPNDDFDLGIDATKSALAIAIQVKRIIAFKVVSLKDQKPHYATEFPDHSSFCRTLFFD
jgi:hypothetical protein